MREIAGCGGLFFFFVIIPLATWVVTFFMLPLPLLFVVWDGLMFILLFLSKGNDSEEEQN